VWIVLRGGQLFFSRSQLTEVYSDDLRLCLWLMSLSSDCHIIWSTICIQQPPRALAKVTRTAKRSTVWGTIIKEHVSTTLPAWRLRHQVRHSSKYSLGASTDVGERKYRSSNTLKSSSVETQFALLTINFHAMLFQWSLWSVICLCYLSV
jgi:hypothetical protein